MNWNVEKRMYVFVRMLMLSLQNVKVYISRAVIVDFMEFWYLRNIDVSSSRKLVS